MKKTISGMSAYSKMIEAKLPEKTASYTPISHSSVISRIRREIVSAGYIITGENYQSTNDGQIAIGSFKINYKSDPDIDLCATFLNSYNKQYAFRFNLGAVEKTSGNTFMLSNSKFGAYKRVHKGSADILAEGKIRDFIKDSDEYWNELVKRKDFLKRKFSTTTITYDVLGHLFFRDEVLNTMQMNTIRSEMKKPSFDYKCPQNTAWTLYNHILMSIKDSHPADWMKHLHNVDDVFCDVFGIPSVTEPEVVSETTIEKVVPF